jgi:vesicle transport protein SEC22
MKKNIDEILNRGEKFIMFPTLATSQNEIKDFKWGAKKLTWQARNAAVRSHVFGGSMVLIVLYVKIFHWILKQIV